MKATREELEDNKAIQVEILNNGVQFRGKKEMVYMICPMLNDKGEFVNTKPYPCYFGYSKFHDCFGFSNFCYKPTVIKEEYGNVGVLWMNEFDELTEKYLTFGVYLSKEEAKSEINKFRNNNYRRQKQIKVELINQKIGTYQQMIEKLEEEKMVLLGKKDD